MPIQQNEDVWFTSNDLAKALGYASTKSISNLYASNYEEFTGAMSMVIQVMTNGINNTLREKKVRIFSLRGAHLIAMFARTPLAKEFRQWVLDILENQVEQSVCSPVAEKLFNLTMTESEMCNLVWLYKAATHLRDDAEVVSKALEPLNSRLVVGLATMASHYKKVLSDSREILKREVGKHLTGEKADPNWVRALETLNIH